MTLESRPHDEAFETWVDALQARHLADLRTQEVTRALRALSSVYVERRGALGRGGALDRAGKRAAFALFYGPLHYLATRRVVDEIGTAGDAVDLVVDVGCGTGAAGAAWAVALAAASAGPRVLGIDRHPWAVSEARWTYRTMHLHGDAREGDAVRSRFRRRRTAIVLAFTVNELPDASRNLLLPRLLGDAAGGARVLVIEPVARSIGPWWHQWAESFGRAGGRRGHVALRRRSAPDCADAGSRRRAESPRPLGAIAPPRGLMTILHCPDASSLVLRRVGIGNRESGGAFPDP